MISTMNGLYINRVDAGRQLAVHLESYCNDPDTIVLGLPRGGIPVAYEVAQAIGAPLDALVVRKLGHPLQPELAIGAIASGGVRYDNERVIEEANVDQQTIEQVEAAELEELKRRELVYRGHRLFPDLSGKCVIIVDDGLATGSTMRAALLAVKKQNAKRTVVAVPLAPPATVTALRQLADDVVCPMTPANFYAIGQFYAEFSPTSDNEVTQLLNRAAELMTASDRES